MPDDGERVTEKMDAEDIPDAVARIFNRLQHPSPNKQAIQALRRIADLNEKWLVPTSCHTINEKLDEAYEELRDALDLDEDG